MKRSLVTGGLGFIGSHVVDLLVSQGHQVWVVDNHVAGNENNKNSKAQYFKADILNSEELLKIGQSVKPQWIFHFAALPQIQPSFADPVRFDVTNVRGCLNVFAMAKAVGVEALIYSSSSAVYGNTDQVPTDETVAVQPLSPYALQKYAGERYLLLLGEREKVPVTSLRYFNVFGPRSFDEKQKFNAYSSVVGIFNRQKKSGNPITITGDGSQQRDFVHVHDIAKANLLIAENIQKSKGEVYNVGSGKQMTVLELAKMFGGEIKHIPEREGEVRISCADNRKLCALGWKPTITVEEAIQKNLL